MSKDVIVRFKCSQLKYPRAIFEKTNLLPLLPLPPVLSSTNTSIPKAIEDEETGMGTRAAMMLSLC
jgi:hypothetical protein